MLPRAGDFRAQPAAGLGAGPPFVAKQIRALIFQLRTDIRHGLYTKTNGYETLPLAWPREAKYGNLDSPAEVSGEG